MPNEIINPVVAATSAGILIRALEPADMPSISRILAQPGVVHGTLQLPFTSDADRSHRWSTTFTDPLLHSLVAETIDTHEVIGNCSLHRTSRPRRQHVASIGMSVDPCHHGAGVGTALLAAIIELAEQWLQISRIELDVYTDNAPALRLYERQGFVVEGTKRQCTWRAGSYVDSHIMARLRDEPAR